MQQGKKYVSLCQKQQTPTILQAVISTKTSNPLDERVWNDRGRGKYGCATEGGAFGEGILDTGHLSRTLRS